MRLVACLTTGWPAPDGDLDAEALDRDAWERAKTESDPDGAYPAILATSVPTRSEPARITGLERLFRRRPGGSRPVQRFVGALLALFENDGADPVWTCEIDAFAYAFLKGAKNFDLLLPEAAGGSFRGQPEGVWRETLRKLEEFERDGADPGNAVDRKAYLALRRVVTRPSARDERRALVTLLLSGPSTSEEIGVDLALGTSLSDRVLAAVAPAIERRDADGRHALRLDRLPVVLFLLRERMGLDPLGALAGRV